MGLRKDYNVESVNKIDESSFNGEHKPNTKMEFQKVDRVVLDSESIKIVESMMNQIEKRWGDLVHVSQKDLVNFLLQKRSKNLSEQEIDLIRVEKFDIVRVLKRATSEAIKAKQSGKEIEFEEILKIIQTPSINLETAPVKAPRRKIKLKLGPDTGSALKQLNSNPDSFKGLNSTDLEIRQSDKKSGELAKFHEQERP
ncbi:MAG: hypothetical protein RJB66_1337 [Pseudomonadota bacterium]